MPDVSLDALIPRADFDAEAESNWVGSRKMSVSASDLKEHAGWFYLLRKPDFQRETNEWDANTIVEFIESFSRRETIPTIILWHNVGSHIFVIDGCHRLSALAAWVNDDYGDGSISKKFYDTAIPEEQKRIARNTRKLVERRLGKYADHDFALANPEKETNSEIVQRARALTTLSIPVQYVDGPSQSAEKSFKKINQRAARINKTEERVLDARRKPSGIASRAIVRGGAGYKYWGNLPLDTHPVLEKLAADVHSLLFEPPLPRPIDTIELPVAGQSYAQQSLAVVLEFVCLSNDTSKEPDSDPDGSLSIKYVQKAKEVAELINSSDAGSLGLHPAVYFYAPNGRHKPASLYGAAVFVQELVSRRKLDDFTSVRRDFEELLLENEFLVQQIVRNARGAAASAKSVSDFYLLCVNLLRSGKDIPGTIAAILDGDAFGNLGRRPDAPAGRPGARFTKETKASVVIRDALAAATRCAICGARIHRNGISIDHDVRREDGGDNSAGNGHTVHPYCNTGYKERAAAKAKALG